VREKLDRLLEHETGHYLIGWICAMEFKKRSGFGNYNCCKEQKNKALQKIFE